MALPLPAAAQSPRTLGDIQPATSSEPSFADIETISATQTAPTVDTALQTKPDGWSAEFVQRADIPAYVPNLEGPDPNQAQVGNDNTSSWHYGALGAGPSDWSIADGSDFSGVFPLVLNDRIEKYLNAYAAHSGALRAAFIRAAPFRKEILEALNKEGVPEEFFYLAFAESAFTFDGDGPWQFTKGTAARFGLRITDYIDERRDPIKSSRMAARYLAELYGQVGDWRLAVVGWNTGDKSVARYIVRRGHSYEQMVDYLPIVTRALMNRMTAINLIARGRGPDSGLIPASFDEPLYDHIKFQAGTPLREIAERARSPLTVIRHLNPQFLKDELPPTGGHYDVLVPHGSRPDTVAAQEANNS